MIKYATRNVYSRNSESSASLEGTSVCEIRIAAVLTEDPRGAALLTGDPGTQRAIKRSPLLRSACHLSAGLAAAAAKSEPRRRDWLTQPLAERVSAVAT